jgi:hypothetical protein
VLWTPLYLSTAPNIWLDHTTTVLESSGLAAEWINAGTASNFTQSTAGSRPQVVQNELNAKRVLRFDGTNDFMECSTRSLFQNVTEGWVFSVIRKRAIDPNDDLKIWFYVSRGTDSAARFTLSANATTSTNRNRLVTRRLDGGAASILHGNNTWGTSWQVVGVEQDWSSGSGVLLINGVIDSTGATAGGGATSNTMSAQAIRIGSEQNLYYSDVDIACFLAGNAAYSFSDRQRLEGYYAHEYALQSNLPADHPFKLYPPYVTTPTLQTNLGSAPAVIGFHAGTDSGQVGLAIGDAVASEFGVLLNSLPALSVGAGITVASAGGDITVRLDDITPPVTPALATIYDYRGETLASVTLSAGSGYYEGTVSGSLVDGRTYYVQIAQA